MQRNPLVALLGLAALLIVAPGCNKEKDTKAIITIQDEDGSRVEGAYVKLYANPLPPLQSDYTRLKKEGMTDSKGQVEFDYTGLYEQGAAGFAVLNITSFKDSAVGEGIIKITEEETNEETVTLEHI